MPRRTRLRRSTPASSAGNAAVMLCVWSACAGIVEMKKESEDEIENGRGHKNVSKVMFHEYVGDVKDGGAAPFLTKLGDRDVPCYVTEPEGENAVAMKGNELH